MSADEVLAGLEGWVFWTCSVAPEWVFGEQSTIFWSAFRWLRCKVVVVTAFVRLFAIKNKTRVLK
jgi:hypothetical protein